MSRTCVKLWYGFATFYRGRWGILNTLFKISIIFCYWLSEIYKKKKKNEVPRMLFQITQICFSESDYVTIHSVMNIMTENSAKMTHKMPQVLSYCYLAPLRKGLLQAHHDKCCSLVKLLCIYFAISTYLTTANHCLTIFFSKIYVSLERSPLDEAKKASNHWKSRNVKNVNGSPTFLTNNYIYIINLLLKSGLIFIISLLMRKTCKNLVWHDNLYLFNHTTWSFLLLKVNFWCYNCWVVFNRCKFVLIVVSNYLTTVNKRLTIFFSKNYVIGKISIRCS